MLQESLGGDSKTCVFVNVRPDEANLGETHSTLGFGQGIRKIELGPATKHRSKRPMSSKRGGRGGRGGRRPNIRSQAPMDNRGVARPQAPMSSNPNARAGIIRAPLAFGGGAMM